MGFGRTNGKKRVGIGRNRHRNMKKVTASYSIMTGRHGTVSIMDMAYGLIVFMGSIGMISSPLEITV